MTQEGPSAALTAARQAALAALKDRRLTDAFAAVRELAALHGRTGEPGGARGVAEIGDLWSLLGEYAAAHTCYTRALALDARAARVRFNRATVARFLGRIEEAEADYDEVLASDPTDAQAHLNRSELRPQSPQHNHIEALERALTRAGGLWQREVPLRYALAKEYEDLGEYARAWQHLSHGARLRRRHLEYDLARDLETVEWIRAAFPAGWVSAGGGFGTQEPIFIIGMPRTGSTLVDRMLGTHREVFCAGELPDFGAAVVAAVRRRGGTDLSRQRLIAASAEIDVAALGRDYLERTRPRTGHTRHFSDKLPLNYLYAGLIARALPDARIVHVTRGPMAACFGMYKVLFDRGYPFSYDLEELADYYLGYRRLMAHWHEVMPGRIVEIGYEALVRDPAREARRLLDALGLAWEPEVLAFHQNPQPVATASAAQVRRPLYASSVSIWRHYERELAPLAARLTAAGLALEP